MLSRKKTLRQLLEQDGIIRVPGAYDAWSARLVEAAGFPAVYMTGYGASASLIGQPDLGLLGMSEMARHAANLSSAVEIPLIADGDTGFGGTLNVIRTVREYERGGVAAIQLEDQVTPKRCGHMDGKEIVPLKEMRGKIEAAAYARSSPDFLIIARTDARAVAGLEEALERARVYARAGADILFVEAPRSVEEMKKVASALDKPLVANMVEGGQTPFLQGEELERMGYKLAIYPVTALFAATRAVQEVLGGLKEEDTTGHALQDMVDFQQFNQLMGLEETRSLEQSFPRKP